MASVAQPASSEGLNIGWASADLTPVKPVLIAGQFHARVSEGVMDPLTATVLAIESVQGPEREQAILISCDFVAISDGMRDPSDLRTRVRQLVKELSPSIKVDRIMLDNMTVAMMRKAVKLIDGRCETEASGGVTRAMLKEIAATGVDYISAGALTHSAKNIDISLKAVRE